LRVRRANGPVAFGVDGQHRVYLVELDNGQVSRFDPR
jgi:streptogramin lyase